MENTQGIDTGIADHEGPNGADVIHEPLKQTSDAEVEQQIQAAGLTGPRLTPEHIKSVVVSEDYVNLDGTTTTICYLGLANGFTVTGESACVDPANFDQAVGCQVAYNNAIGRVWQLEGYLLKQRMHEAEHTELTDDQAEVLFTRTTAYVIGHGDVTEKQGSGLAYRFLRQELAQWLLPLRDPT